MLYICKTVTIHAGVSCSALDLSLEQHKQDTFTLKLFFLFLCYLGVKSPITKIIEKNKKYFLGYDIDLSQNNLNIF